MEVHRVLGDEAAAQAALDHAVEVAEEHADFAVVGHLVAGFGDDPCGDDPW